MIFLLDALYKLGKLVIEKENLNEIDVLLDNKKIGATILVEFIQDDEGNLTFDKVFHEEYDAKNKVKYLYKKGSSRGTDITPSCLITDLDKTFNNKFIKWFEKNESGSDLFKNLNDEIISKKDDIYDGINDILNDLDVKGSNILLSIVITENGKIHYLNDFDEFSEILIKESLKKYQGPKKIKGEGICCLCDKHKEVYGLVSSSIGFSFSTAEKVGNVPGINIKDQWKLLPICSDCALYLNAGKNFVEKYLDFSEFGLNYYVIPNFLVGSEKAFDRLYNDLKLFENEEDLKSTDLVNIEYKLSKIVKRLDDVAELKFLFYQSSNSAFDILAYVESVIPSYLNNLYDTQLKIAEYDFFREDNLKLIFKDNHEGDFINLINKNEKHYKCSYDNWYKRFLRDFINNFSRKMYIDTVVDILSNKRLDYNFLLSRIMDKIRSNWRNNENYALKVSVLKSLMLLILFNDLNLIKGENMMSLNDEEFSIDLILNSPDKKATFLLGVLTRKLMNIQYKELGSTPFYNKLWGLSLDQKKIHKLYPMVINKLQEYNAGYMRDLENEISINLAKSENDWKLNRDETSYYFVLGFTLLNYNKKDSEDDINE